MIRQRAKWHSLTHLGHRTFCLYLELRLVPLKLNCLWMLELDLEY